MRPWAEPYEVHRDHTTFTLFLAFLALIMVGVFVAEAREPHLGWLVPPAGLVVAGVYAWRISTVGVAVNDHGVRLRRVLWTRVIPWSQVERAWVGPARRQSAEAMWITVRKPGEPEWRDVETLLWLQGAKDWSISRNAVPLSPAGMAHVVELINQRARDLTRG
jgi:hypothetical protein